MSLIVCRAEFARGFGKHSRGSSWEALPHQPATTTWHHRRALTEFGVAPDVRLLGTHLSPTLSSDRALFPQIEAALESIPATLLGHSGRVFYSGRSAFSAPNDLYILGLNPGGDPEAQAAEAIGADLLRFRTGPPCWSAYADESWHGAAPGTWGMAPRVLHLMKALGRDPRAVPASNVIFVRSSTEAMLRSNKTALLQACWPVHQAVIEAMRTRVVLCFGGTAGRWVREQLGARRRFDSYRETNGRGWLSESHACEDGRRVLTLTHPGRANWCNPDADPTCLVKRALNASQC